MLQQSKSGHPGSSLSAVEILYVLYYRTLVRDKEHFGDRFILSKGHAAPALYSVLIEIGDIPLALESALRGNGSPLQGHPDDRFLKSLGFNSGSLGQNLSVAAGMALGYKLYNSSSRIFVLLGDGELQEGQIWEAAMAAAHLGLGNLIAIVDVNGLQLDGPTEKVMSLGNLAQKWKSFGWEVAEVDGHDTSQLESTLKQRFTVPFCILAKTTKGKGVNFMEGVTEWHSIHSVEAAERLIEALKNL